jgi:ribonucleoside-diphosphate reductase alpha chain
MPFLKVANDAAVAVNQGGKRKGAALLPISRPGTRDVDEFLDLRKNTGDDRRRTHDIAHRQLGAGPVHEARRAERRPVDAVLARTTRAGSCTTCTGEGLREAAYERVRDSWPTKAAINNFQPSCPRLDLWRKMLTPHVRNGPPLGHVQGSVQTSAAPQAPRGRGAQHQSLHRDHAEHQGRSSETAVCNLGSVNLLGAHRATAKLDEDRSSAKTVNAAPCACSTTSSSINYYPAPDRRATPTCRHRPVGLGDHGLPGRDLCKLRLPLRARRPRSKFADRSRWKRSAYFAIQASVRAGSPKSAAPTPTFTPVRSGIAASCRSTPSSWSSPTAHAARSTASRTSLAVGDPATGTALRARDCRRVGMRNTNVHGDRAHRRPSPTITGVSQSIEPAVQATCTCQDQPVGRVHGQVNEHLAERPQGAWTCGTRRCAHDLKYHDGSRAEHRPRCRSRSANEI